MLRMLTLVIAALLCASQALADAQSVLLSLNAKGKVLVTFKNGPFADKSTSAWRGKMRESMDATHELRIQAGEGLPIAEATDFARYAYKTYDADRVFSAESGPLSEALEELESKVAPIALRVQIDPQGTPLNLRTGAPWAGVGLFGYGEDRVRSWTVLGQSFSDPKKLAAAVDALRAKLPSRPLVLDLGPGANHSEDWTWAQEQLQGIELPGMRVRAWANPDARWTVMGFKPSPLTTSEYAIYDIDFDGRITRTGQLLVDPGDPNLSNPYLPVLEDAKKLGKRFARFPKNNPALLSSQFVLLRSHPNAPFLHASRLVHVLAHPDVRAPRVELLSAGQEPATFEKVWLPVDDAATRKGKPVFLRIAALKMGKRIPLDANHPTGAFRYDETRELAMRLQGKDLQSLQAFAQAWEAEQEKGRPSTLILEAGPDVTFGEVVTIVQNARAAGVGNIGFSKPQQWEGDDYR